MHDDAIPTDKLGEDNGDNVEIPIFYERVRQSEELYKEQTAALRQMGYGCVMIAYEGHRITLMDSGAKDIFGYAGQDIRGTSIHQMVPAKVRPRHKQHIEQAFHSKERSGQMGAKSNARFLLGLTNFGEEIPLDLSFMILLEMQIAVAFMRRLPDDVKLPTQTGARSYASEAERIIHAIANKPVAAMMLGGVTLASVAMYTGYSPWKDDPAPQVPRYQQDGPPSPQQPRYSEANGQLDDEPRRLTVDQTIALGLSRLQTEAKAVRAAFFRYDDQYRPLVERIAGDFDDTTARLGDVAWDEAGVCEAEGGAAACPVYRNDELIGFVEITLKAGKDNHLPEPVMAQIIAVARTANAIGRALRRELIGGRLF